MFFSTGTCITYALVICINLYFRRIFLAFRVFQMRIPLNRRRKNWQMWGRHHTSNYTFIYTMLD